MKSEKIKLCSMFLLCGSNFGTNLYADSSTNLDTNLSQAKLSDIVVTATKTRLRLHKSPQMSPSLQAKISKQKQLRQTFIK